MKKILVSIATTLMAATVLIACNGDGTNSSDVSSGGASKPLAKAVCTSSNNWQSVGIGMSADQVQARLGAPAKISSTAASTLYEYERCRAGLFQTKDATDTKPAEFSTIYFGGSLEISGSRGVLKITSPFLDSEFPMVCEWNLYDYPFNYGGGVNPGVCRTSNNPF